MPVFEEASYLAQVHRLRHLALRVLLRYPVEAISCRLVNHGENTTFRITTRQGRKLLLRIHRHGYHTRAAILEELRSLALCSDATPLSVPRPVRSLRGRWLEAVATPEVGTERQCCLFDWIEGHFVRKPVRPWHMVQLGQVAGMLQKAAGKLPVKERRYWDAEGLVGKNAKFGSLETLPDTTAKSQTIINEARKLIVRKLRRFEKTFPHKMGFIHADLHFGNILFRKQGIAVIDFDDCGFGFRAYDLAVSLNAISYTFPDVGRDLQPMKEALIQGYAAEVGWDASDEAILPYLVSARKLALLGWLRSRSDNPRLRRLLGDSVVSTVKHLRKAHHF